MDRAREKVLLQLGNLIVPILCIAFITLSNLDFSTVFNSSAYPNMLNPAQITFAIWGPIFVFQGNFYFYQARDLFKPSEKKIDMPYVHEVSVFFMLSWISTTIWYALWASGFVWPAVAAMYAYLLTSLGAYFRLDINKRERPLIEHLFVTVPWSMLCGWVTIATIVNTTTGFVSVGFEPGPIGETGWAIIMLVVILIIYLTVLMTRNDYVFAGVGLWAIMGVLIERSNPLYMRQPWILLTCAFGLLILVTAMGTKSFLKQESRKVQTLERRVMD